MFEFQGKKIVKNENGDYVELIDTKEIHNKGRDKLMESDMGESE